MATIKKHFGYKFQKIFITCFRFLYFFIFCIAASYFLEQFALYSWLRLHNKGIVVSSWFLAYWSAFNTLVCIPVMFFAYGAFCGSLYRMSELNYQDSLDIIAWNISDNKKVVLKNVPDGFMFCLYKDGEYDFELAEYNGSLGNALSKVPSMLKQAQKRKEVSE